MRGKAIDAAKELLLMSPETGPPNHPLFDRGGRFVGFDTSLPSVIDAMSQARGSCGE